jgi:hypothetical protein
MKEISSFLYARKVTSAFHSFFSQEKIRLALYVQKAAMTFIDGMHVLHTIPAAACLAVYSAANSHASNSVLMAVLKVPSTKTTGSQRISETLGSP